MAPRQGAQAVWRQEPFLRQHLGQEPAETDRRHDAELTALVAGPTGHEPALAETLAGDVQAVEEAREPLPERLLPSHDARAG